MYQGGIVRAHGGQGGAAGQVVQLQGVEAVLRGTTRTIRVWQGFGAAEEFTIPEARELCAKADTALTSRSAGDEAGLWLDRGGALAPLIVSRRWLVAFLAAVRRALRTADAVGAMEPGFRPDCVDAESDPGSWAEQLSFTAAMRGGVADSS